MRGGILVSKADPLSRNVLKALAEEAEGASDRLFEVHGVPVIVVEEPLVPEPSERPDLDGLAERAGVDYLAVVYRHESAKAIPCLTVHATGNFGEPAYGGEARQLQRVPANPMRRVFLRLLEGAPEGYRVSLEATHHPPTSYRTPMFFAEVGSSEEQWSDPRAYRCLAEAVVEALRDVEASRVPAVVGFGGGHYAPTFSKMETEYAFGHVCSKYSVDLLDLELVSQMVERTVDGVELAFVEKGLKGRRRRMVAGLLDELGVEWRLV